MKDEFNYWKDLAMRAVQRYYQQRIKVQDFNGICNAEQFAEVDTADACGITQEEVICINDRDADGAYAKYCEENPPYHEYVVSYEMPPVTGTVRVKALSEDEAEEYVESNIMFDGVNIGMADEDDMLDDPELDEWGTEGNASVTDVDDEGEYEED